MSRVFNRQILRSVSGSLGRFVALAAIVALGSGFYAGLRMTGQDMRLALDAYFDATAMMDVRIVSTLGMDSESIDELSQVEGVDAVMPAYETDVMASLDGTQYVMRLHSVPSSIAQSECVNDYTAESTDDTYLNRLVLTEGRWPVSVGECVINGDRIMSKDISLGAVITVEEGTSDLDDVLSQREYTVVGKAHVPSYICSASLGSSVLGNGSLAQCLYVLEDNFAEDMPYTEVFLTLDGARDLQSGSDAYQQWCADQVLSLEDKAAAFAEGRTNRVVDKAQAELDEQREEIESELDAAQAQLDGAWVQLNNAVSELSSGKAQLEQSAADLQDSEERLEALQATYDEQFALLQTLPQGHPSAEVLSQQLALLKAQLDDGWEQLAQGKAAYEQGLSTYNASLASYQASWADYQSGLAELESARAQADEELAEAQAKIDDIVPAEWYVMDRTKNYGSESYLSDAARIDSIARVFPLIFFLVAALVALTTMTRMVEEERMVIGTYKALGYSKGRIASKYLLYAAAASGLGSFIGVALLSQVFPRVIMKAYAILYTVPVVLCPLDIPITVLSVTLGMGVTLLATWAAVYTALREKPAALMLPKLAKSGKRIVLERVGFVWSRLSFTWKVTCRNLFLYKKRLFMTIIGIAGCTGLLLTGLALHDSINDILDNQFVRIAHYDATIALEQDASDEDRAAVQDLLDDPDYVQDFEWVQRKSMLVSPESGADLNIDVLTPEDPEHFENFVSMQTRRGHESLSLGQTGAVLTEKAAHNLGISVGDTLLLYTQNEIGTRTDESYAVTVTGIMEYYVNNALYLGPETAAQLWDDTSADCAYVITAFEPQADAEEGPSEAFYQNARTLEGVRTVSYTNSLIETYRTMLRTIDLIVAVLVISAALLAFVVLYNLTNINITERQREIATLKVLGFTAREVRDYIYRETAVLAVIGSALGLFLGIFMAEFVVQSAEVNQVMFGRVIHPESFVIAFALSLVFVGVVMLFMRGKFAHVNMVESLKSVE